MPGRTAGELAHLVPSKISAKACSPGLVTDPTATHHVGAVPTHEIADSRSEDPPGDAIGTTLHPVFVLTSEYE
ncbi:MAG TPA: hypothetical protein VFN50_08300 [Acidimicrobiales bacterium]|nr:hypothetical protein [Acidimicrobiales bacterium]